MKKVLAGLAVLLLLAVVVVGEGYALSWGGPTLAVPATTTTTVPTSTTSTSSTTTTLPYPVLGTCAHAATLTYIAADYVRFHFDATNPNLIISADLYGHVAKLICGGPDDSHYNVSTTAVTVTLVPTAKIILLSFAQGLRFFTGSPELLNNYVAADQDGNIFLVTGPTTAATGATAMFHP